MVRTGIGTAREAVSDAKRLWGEYLDAAAATLRADGYATVAGAIPGAHVSALRRYFSALVRGGFLGFEKEAAEEERRLYEHNNPIGRLLLLLLHPLVVRLAGEPLKPSYPYFASYARGTELPKHTDRAQCEYTVSLLVDFEPRSRHELKWPIRLDLPGRDGRVRTLSINQHVGDMLIFRGRRLPHYRSALRRARRTLHLFLHYVHADFTGTLY
jgi:hypothetical protein